MADAADLAADLGAAHLDVALARINPAIANGVAGECQDCGETMPRLVGGRCGYCRDGRLPPLSHFDDPPTALMTPPAAPPLPQSPTKETVTMTAPATPDFQTISVPAKGPVLAAIKARAEKDGEPLGRSAAALILDAMTASLAADVGSTPAPPALVDASVEDLLEALRSRLAAGVPSTDYEAAIDRAEVAEARLAIIGDALAGRFAPSGGAQ